MLSLSSSKIDSIGELKGLARVAVSFATAVLLSVSPMGGNSPSLLWSLIESASADDSSSILNSNSNSPSLTVGKSVTLPSGVQYYDAIVGDGPIAADEGRTVQFKWVLRRANGYFVDSNADSDEPFIYRVGNLKKVIKGVDEAIRGMRTGGVRRINIPPNMAFVDGVGDDKPGPMPYGFGPRRQVLTRMDREVWYFEVKMIKIK
eukprot:gene34212-45883_t